MVEQSLGVSDVIKKSVASQFSGVLNPLHVLLTLVIAFGLGLFILFIYRKTFSGVLYSRSFGLSIVLVTMITALIILPISSNIVLSLGMVGALSIVRFRTAVKDPMDTMFLFWGIAAGLCSGASFWGVAIIGSLFIGLVMVLLTTMKFKMAMPYLLVLHYREEASNDVRKMLPMLPKHRLKSKVLRSNSIEMTLEVRLDAGQEKMLDQLMDIPGVNDVSLLSYQGELIS